MISGFGFLVYFFPAFFSVSKSSEVFGYLCFPLIFLISTMVLYDLIFSKSFFFNLLTKKASFIEKRNDMNFFSVVSVVFTFFLFSLLFYQTGVEGFFSSKTDRSYNAHVYNLFISFLCIGTVLSFYINTWHKYIYIFFLFILFLSGDRTAVIISLLAVFFSVTFNSRRFSFISIIFNFRTITTILFVIFIGVYGKSFYGSIAVSYVNDEPFFAVFYNSIKDSGFMESFEKTEPFHIMSIFSKVVESDYVIDSQYLVNLPYHFLPITTPFTDTLHHYSLLLKNEFFSSWGESSGVAANFWAEGFSNFRIFGVVLFSLCYCLILFFFQILVHRFPVYFVPFFGLMASYIGFYIHRNSVFQILSHSKRVFYGFLLLTIIVTLLLRIKKIVKR